VLWRCWLGGRKGIWPVKKTWVVGCWRGCLWSTVQTCIWPSWCHCQSLSCFSKIQIGFTFLVPAHLGSPGKGPLNRCVCVCAFPPHVLLLLQFWKKAAGDYLGWMSFLSSCHQCQNTGRNTKHGIEPVAWLLFFIHNWQGMLLPLWYKLHVQEIHNN